ncbi:uncharacterized protein LOC120562439 [Perca fluviatilis]|uniref:uncharacterized protein LOC120562439 n=1 Tax=Perca fluviatilis TaxID=8168 RepID=UPI0019633D10|nr:uncharacterized protein LOC120562439 [Perca fluviatilis]
MEGQSRSSNKYLLLQVWCGILTGAMVVMAALVISIKPNSTEVSTSVTGEKIQSEQFWTTMLRCTFFFSWNCDTNGRGIEEVSTLKPETVSPTGLTVNTIAAPLKGKGCFSSYIELKKSFGSHYWQESTPKCHSPCSLVLLNNTIHCNDNGIYFIYAQVTFNKPKKSQTKSVILKRNASPGKQEKTLVEGTFPNTTVGTVWVAKTVRLTEGDSVSLNITDDFQADGASTFWGANRLH